MRERKRGGRRDTFKLSLTSGGTAINLTDIGFGTRYVTRVQWQKLL